MALRAKILAIRRRVKQRREEKKTFKSTLKESTARRETLTSPMDDLVIEELEYDDASEVLTYII